MREVVGNLWTYPADIRVITTNGTVKNDGTCVMGRGCAAEAKRAIQDFGYERLVHIGRCRRKHE